MIDYDTGLVEEQKRSSEEIIEAIHYYCITANICSVTSLQSEKKRETLKIIVEIISRKDSIFSDDFHPYINI